MQKLDAFFDDLYGGYPRPHGHLFLFTMAVIMVVGVLWDIHWLQLVAFVCGVTACAVLAYQADAYVHALKSKSKMLKASSGRAVAETFTHVYDEASGQWIERPSPSGQTTFAPVRYCMHCGEHVGQSYYKCLDCDKHMVKGVAYICERCDAQGTHDMSRAIAKYHS